HFLLNGSLNAEVETLPGYVNAWLNELNHAESYVDMPDWDEWLSQMLSTHDKGVFLLRADRAMGKTAFVSHLDPLMEGDELLADTVVARAYYCGRRRFRQKDDFLDQMNSGMFQKLSATEQIEGKRFQIQLDDCEMQPAVQLSAYLGFYLDYYRKYYGLEEEGKVLLIIDGIDEISFMQSMGETGILDYIPKAEDLPEHVYILITSRIEEEQPETYASEFVNRYDFSGRVMYRRRDPEGCVSEIHKRNLQRFVQDRLKWTADSEESNRIIELSDGNYINLKMLIKMMQGMEKDTVQAFLQNGFQPEHHLEEYLTAIYQNGGVKYGSLVDQLLTVICSAMEPISLRTIAFLTNFSSDMITCDLLGAISDIDALLQVDRAGDGSVIRLSNLKYRKKLQERYISQIHSLVDNAISYIFSVYDTGIRIREEKQRLRDDPNVSEAGKEQLETFREILLQMYQKKEIIYIHAYIMNYLQILKDLGDDRVAELESRICSLDFLNCLADFERWTDGKQHGFWGSEKDRLISSEIIEIGEKLHFEDTTQEAERLHLLTVAYNCRSFSLLDLGNAGEAVKDLDLAIEYGLKAQELGYEKTDFGLLFNSKAVYLRKIGRPFDEYRIWIEKSLEYKKKKLEEDFRHKVEAYLVSVANYIKMMYTEKRYDEMDEYHDLIFGPDGILAEIHRRFPGQKYMIDEDGTRYEYGYYYLSTCIYECYVRSFYDRGMLTVREEIDWLMEVEQDYRRLIERNRQMVDEKVQVQEPLIRSLYKCLFYKGEFLMMAERTEESKVCWKEVVTLIRDLDRSKRLLANKGLREILETFVKNRPFDVDTQAYVDEVYKRLFGEE
ncbi:MAG: hypothetical protein K5897_03300, partial [Eubacterium sp.]|nr:hypothetical protein [Eubacterium sp.]